MGWSFSRRWCRGPCPPTKAGRGTPAGPQASLPNAQAPCSLPIPSNSQAHTAPHYAMCCTLGGQTHVGGWKLSSSSRCGQRQREPLQGGTCLGRFLAHTRHHTAQTLQHCRRALAPALRGVTFPPRRLSHLHLPCLPLLSHLHLPCPPGFPIVASKQWQLCLASASLCPASRPWPGLSPPCPFVALTKP